MVNSEQLYILKRWIKSVIYSIPFYICRIFPLQLNKIVMWTFEGEGGFGCCPKYIAEELLKQRNNHYEIVWIVSDVSKEFPKEIKKIKDTWWNRAYHLSTAKLWIGNTRLFWGTKKRKGTLYIQTWHGTLSLKPIGKYRGEKFSKIAYIVSNNDSKLIDYVISGSDYCTEMWRDGLIYDGDIKQLGTARCDVLINSVEEKHIQFRNEYNIPKEAKICLYAPTFRGGSQNTNRSIDAENSTLDFDGLIESLQNRFGGSWYIFLRLHPQLLSIMDRLPVSGMNNRMIDVSKRPDMSEIMAATDCIITDYSTVIFEGFLTGQPGFIYADDFNEYVADRGSLMFTSKDIPFSIAQSNAELQKNIAEFDDEDYKLKSKMFVKKYGIHEDGQAAERLVDFIMRGK